MLFIVIKITTNKYLLSSYLRSLPEQTSINQLSYYSPFSIHFYLLSIRCDCTSEYLLTVCWNLDIVSVERVELTLSN